MRPTAKGQLWLSVTVLLACVVLVGIVEGWGPCPCP